MRRLRNTPSYFFLIWRWSTWIFALIWIVTSKDQYTVDLWRLGIILLTVTFLQSLVVTLYAPVFQVIFPWLPGFRKLPLYNAGKQRLQQKQRRMVWGFRRPRLLIQDEDADIVSPLAQTRIPYWDIAIYALDVIICGLAVYFGGALGLDQTFGNSSPFYRYGFSAAFAAAFAYRYRGAISASLGYELFILLSILFPPLGVQLRGLTGISIESSFLDVPLASILAAYLATLLGSYTRTKREVQDNARTQHALVRVGETLLKEANNQRQLLEQSAHQIRQGGHFQRLIIALVEPNTNGDVDQRIKEKQDITYIESDVLEDVENIWVNRNQELPKQVLQSGEKVQTFEPLADSDAQEGIARLYLPFFKDGQVHMVLGAESRRQTPFSEKQEKFLTISGTQLLIVLDNIRLTEQTIQLAAAAERGRIAREIHDGVAQLVYMLSLNAETAATQARRIAEASEEDAELLTPLAERLDKQVTISKQALWETRNYMFNLRPLISGTTTLPQMISNQLREFQAISGLSTYLDVQGEDIAREAQQETQNGNGQQSAQHMRRYDKVGTAIFRIVQEALTNAYKHAEATQIQVLLHQQTDGIEVTIQDNGRGLQTTQYDYELATTGEKQRIYSGHGLHGMRERTAELGGTFTITQVPSGGVQVRAYIPM